MARGSGNRDWKNNMTQWMQGRYGIDELTRALMMVGCALIVINFFVGSALLSLLSLVVIVFAMVRVYSRNFPQRARELETYERLMERPRAWFRLTKHRWDNRKTTVYFKCKGCGTVLNVPRGKGKMRITCPKCGTKTERRS